jgi:hypothetical protein
MNKSSQTTPHPNPATASSSPIEAQTVAIGRTMLKAFWVQSAGHSSSPRLTDCIPPRESAAPGHADEDDT